MPERAKEIEKALKFYSQRSNYTGDITCPVMVDLGKKAKDVLRNLPKSEIGQAHYFLKLAEEKLSCYDNHSPITDVKNSIRDLIEDLETAYEDS